MGNTRNAHATTVAQALVHERVSPLLWPHLPLALAWVPTSGTQGPTCVRAPTSCNEGSQPTNRHERARASCMSTRTESHTRTSKAKRPPHGLSTCAGHAMRPQSSATAPTTALQPHLKSNRCGTFPKIEPDFEGVGRAPTARRRILVVSGPRDLNRMCSSISPLNISGARAPRSRTTHLRCK